MFNSLKLYGKYFLVSAFSPAGKYVVRDVNRYLLKKDPFIKIPPTDDDSRKTALDKAVRWLIEAQKANPDGGMGSFHLINKWSSSYPETTGYIIPTLINYGKKYNETEPAERAENASDFLLKIQRRSGGWQGGRVAENKPEIVFNTGQVMRGMIAAYQHTGKKQFLESCVAAGNWLSEIQHPEGFWKEHALMKAARVYDTFVDAPLLDLYGHTGDEKLKSAAIRNLDWVVNVKMTDNGWFEDCDNTVKRNDRPVLHTIAYTLDGLIDSGIFLKDEKYISAAEKGAAKLRDLFLMNGFLHGRYDRKWQGSENIICTGSAQMAIVWMKLYRSSGEEKYVKAAGKMIDLLIFIQNRIMKETPDTLGAIPGSYPLWGRYEPFAYPNWATKFFADALMLEDELRS